MTRVDTVVPHKVPRILRAGGLGGLVACAALLTMFGCQTPTGGQSAKHVSQTPNPELQVRRVVQMFDQRPWLNLDAAGDRNYEGLAFRVFLDDGRGRGTFREGKLHIEMYRVSRDAEGMFGRELVSDWHYETKDLPRIAHPGMLGPGYHLHLRWAKKDIIGSEVEVITQFEDPSGRITRSGTKRLRVPKYDS